MAYEFAFSFDLKFIHNVFRRDFIWRYVVIAIALLAVIVGFRISQGPLSPSLWIILALGWLALVGIMAFKYVQGLRRVLEVWTKQSPSRTMNYQLDENSISVTMENASSRYAFKDCRKLWRYPEVWMLEVAPKHSLPLKPDTMSDEAKHYLVQQLEAHQIPT